MQRAAVLLLVLKYTVLFSPLMNFYSTNSQGSFFFPPNLSCLDDASGSEQTPTFEASIIEETTQQDRLSSQYLK